MRERTMMTARRDATLRRPAAGRGLLAAALLALLSFEEDLLSASSPVSPSPPKTAVVATAVQDLFMRPDETSPVDYQAILGERVDVLEDAAGLREGPDGRRQGRLDSRALAAPRRRRGCRGHEGRARDVEFRSRLRDARPSPPQKPLLTAPVGATMS